LLDAKEHKANGSRLRHEGRQVSESVRPLFDALADLDSYLFRFDEEKITILRPDPDSPKMPGCTVAMNIIATVPAKFVNVSEVKRLTEAFSESKKSAARITAELGDIGITL